jgi:ubiquinone biosynthesis protein
VKRLKSEWTPTPIQTPPTDIPLRTPSPPSRVRPWQILGMGLGVLARVLARQPPEAIGRYVADRFTALGGLWVKVGQLLSLRLDLFPRAFCRQLTSLQGRATQFPERFARDILAEQLPAFDEFDWTPVAAASMAQVYRARLALDQTVVAVKVRTPFAGESYLRDLKLLRRFARLANWFVPRLRLLEGVAELRRVIVEELDFRFEADAQRRMRKLLKAHGVYVPKVFTAYCTSRVLVTEWAPGVPLSDYLALRDRDPAAASAWALDNHINPRKAALTLLFSQFRQIFEDNRFHADLNPGNILLLRGSRVVLVDFGTTGTTESEFLDTFHDLMAALAGGEYAWAADLCCLLCAGLPAKSWWVTKLRYARRMSTLKDALKESMQSWAKRTEVPQLDYHTRSLNAGITALMQAVLKSKGAMQWEWLRIQRTITTLDGSLAMMLPDADYRRLMAKYLSAAMDRAPSGAVIDAFCRLVQRMPEWERLVGRLPEHVRIESARIRQLAMPLQG